MAIENDKLTGISVFKRLDLNISPGNNIIIGENGNGKTHLLKMIYFSYVDRECTLEEKYIRKYNDKKNYQSNALVTYSGNETCWIQNNGKKMRNRNEKDPVYNSKGW